MIRIDCFRHGLLLVFVAFSSLVSRAATGPRIIPLETEAVFSVENAGTQWSVPIKSTDGMTVYILSLEPFDDNRHHPVLVSLVLKRVGDKRESPNRLAPTGNWHGLQAYDFAGGDLKDGVQKSTFGERRTVVLKDLGLIIHINISKVVVSPVSAEFYEVNMLDLQIEVNNLEPRK